MSQDRWVEAELWINEGKRGEKVWALVESPDDPGEYLALWGPWDPNVKRVPQKKRIKMTRRAAQERISKKFQEGYACIGIHAVNLSTGETRPATGDQPASPPPQPTVPTRDPVEEWVKSARTNALI